MISLRVQVARVGQTKKQYQKQTNNLKNKQTVSETNKHCHNDPSQSPSRESEANKQTVSETKKTIPETKKTISEANTQSQNDLSQSPSRESGTNGTREPPVHTAHTAQV